jgi:hypothetical protein
MFTFIAHCTVLGCSRPLVEIKDDIISCSYSWFHIHARDGMITFVWKDVCTFIIGTIKFMFKFQSFCSVVFILSYIRK